MSVKLAVSLVTYNGEKYLQHCLHSLFKQSYQDWQLFILDNASDDATNKVIDKMVADRLDVAVLPVKKSNIGFARAHNEIIKKTDTPYILLLNQDVILTADYIQRLVGFLDNNEHAGAVAGKLLRWQLADGLVEMTDVIDSVGLVINKNFQIVDEAAGRQDLGNYDSTREVFGVSGAVPCFRRAALDQVGCFDKKFFAYKEDVDLAMRLRHAGWQAYCVGGAVAYHARSLRAGKKNNNLVVMNNRRVKSILDNYLSYRNHWYILIKDVALLDYIKYGIFICWYELKKLVYLLVFEQKTLYAWFDIVRFLPTLLHDRKHVNPKSLSQWIK